MTTNNSSRRQRLYDIVKTAKDSYLPTIQTTVTQLASEAKSKAITYTESFQANTAYSSNGQSQRQLDPNGGGYNQDVRGAKIIIYPHFTRQIVEDGKISYATQAHGLVYHNEGGARKKKLFLKLAKQLVKTRDTNNGEYEEKLKDFNRSVRDFHEDDTGLPVYPKRPGTGDSDDSSVTTASSDSYADDVLKERISAFFYKSLGNLELTIAVGGATRDELEIQHTVTDALGNFNMDLISDFKPTYMQVAVTQDEKIFSYKETFFHGDSSYGIITDIDDTIKRTGVCGDKRTLFRNCFVDDIQTWEIPGAAEFLKKNDSNGMPIFYVSNSPYQLFDNLTKFFEYFQFPVGSMYLKKYSGNFLGSMWEPSHARKRAALERIIAHYGDKKFFLIGDSGEQDLEAYTDLAKSYPEHVMGIFVRVADESMTEDTYLQIQRVLSTPSKGLKDSGGAIASCTPTSTSRKPDHVVQYFNEDDDLIDLDQDLIYESHLLDLEKQSEEKSGKVLKQDLTLEKDDVDNSFFLDSPPPPPPPPRSRKPPPVPLKPEHLRRKPPPIPNKPEYLKNSDPGSQGSNNSATIVGVDGSIATVQCAPVKNSGRLPPSLPQRPIPTPPTHRSSNNAYLNSVPSSPISGTYNQYNLNSPTMGNVKMLPYCTVEKTDEWLGRIFTAKLLLEKLPIPEGNVKIKLHLFKNYNEVMNDIERIMQKDQGLKAICDDDEEGDLIDLL
ncbi:hypothetical protein WICPIJ_000554 [Wickerhamomyces pijperi]|uniref:Phosphatidate phosphatase APP1 catalytic domain-containing protein n=1 Tax=Wickerhamomyces pijperi TaxID=599730 RepID=A0A9P8TRQ7_WICPI|nr:hypothetical protein WICPIJ_000554 [Wickerhamomyces pijperi]